jgi:hypothetical protein
LVEQLIRKKLTKVYLVGFCFFLTRSVLDEGQFTAFRTNPSASVTQRPWSISWAILLKTGLRHNGKHWRWSLAAGTGRFACIQFVF